VKANAIILMLILAGSALAVDLPVNCDFDSDTPGSAPAIGGPHQPSEISVPPGGSILVQTDANGIATQPCVIDDGGTGNYGLISFMFEPISTQIIRMEALLSLNQIMNSYPIQTIDSGGFVAFRMGVNDLGQINDYLGTVLGVYTPGVPFAVRIDANTISETWSCTIDDELNGFEDDTTFSGLGYVNDPELIVDLKYLTFCTNTWNTLGTSILAVDDVRIELMGTDIDETTWSGIKALY
jgi:hypothetical protein